MLKPNWVLDKQSVQLSNLTAQVMEQFKFIGQVLRDRYRIQSVLGGQIGRRTFLANDLQTGLLVVIKLLLFSPDFTWEYLKLFEREAKVLKFLEHPAIPQYLDYFDVEMELGKGFALVQTYIEAKSLSESFHCDFITTSTGLPSD